MCSEEVKLGPVIRLKDALPDMDLRDKIYVRELFRTIKWTRIANTAKIEELDAMIDLLDKSVEDPSSDEATPISVVRTFTPPGGDLYVDSY